MLHDSYKAGDIICKDSLGMLLSWSDHAEKMWDMDEVLLFQVPGQYERFYNMNLNDVSEL